MIAVVVFALSAALAIGPPQDRHLRRLEPPVPTRHHPRWLPLAVGACAVLAMVWVLLGTRVLGWMVAGGMLLGTAAWLIHRTLLDRRRAVVRSETARATKTLALMLQAGQIPTLALADAATDCAALESVAHTGRLGGDVAAAFNELGAVPGGAGYRRVAAAWYASERTGAPIAVVLERVAENLRQERHLAAVIGAELATARASGRIMALLPFVAIALGALAGAQPLEFLFGSWPGQVAFLAGTVLVAGGVIWTEWIARSGESARERK